MAVKTWKSKLSIALLSIGMSARAAAGPDEDAIRKLRGLSNEAIARHDIEAFMAFLDEDYQITTSLGQMSHGRDEERRSITTLFQNRPDVVYVRTPERVELSRQYPLAAESGTWVGTWTSAQGKVTTGGSFSAMWRKVGGEWKIRSELFVALYCEGRGCP